MCLLSSSAIARLPKPGARPNLLYHPGASEGRARRCVAKSLDKGFDVAFELLRKNDLVDPFLDLQEFKRKREGQRARERGVERERERERKRESKGE